MGGAGTILELRLFPYSQVASSVPTAIEIKREGKESALWDTQATFEKDLGSGQLWSRCHPK